MRNVKKLWLSVIALVACAFLAKAVLPEPYGSEPADRVATGFS